MGEHMEGGVPPGRGPDLSQPEPLIERATLCLSDYASRSVVQAGDDGFPDALNQYVPSIENNALERLVQLKTELRWASTHEFWAILLKELCAITGAQCGFVTKRILVNDDEIAVELPEPSELGPCIVGIATYISDGNDIPERGYQYHADRTPCPSMRHHKVCVVPEKFAEICPDSLKVFPGKQCEAFIGIPLFHDGKCFANFGVVWDVEGSKTRGLGWGFIELMMHSLEDMILQRILDGRGFAKDPIPADAVPDAAPIVPVSAITPSQSLKPYAQSLSHELRTPMQGVVGMLDIMYATVLDAIANQQNDHLRAVFTDLKGYIEMVQDSSKRAVEAADNVVHACDLNMQMPDAPLTPTEPGGQSPSVPVVLSTRARGDSGSSTNSSSGNKRSSGHGADPNFQPGPPSKRMFKMTETEIVNTYYHVSQRSSSMSGPSRTVAEVITPRDRSMAQLVPETAPMEKNGSITTPCVAHANYSRITTRDFVRNLVNVALRAAHPTSEIHTETDLGETIEVRNLGSRGEMQKRTICLSVDREVPEVIRTDVQNLEFPLQKVIDNAIKFTESGSITITVRLGTQLQQMLEISVADTGRGITEESKQSLFTPHFQEDASISRARDGLGLSLFNAKAKVRIALGGDVTLERSATEGPSKGSEFLIRLPMPLVEAGSTDPPLVGLPSQLGQQCCRSEPLPSHTLSTRTRPEPAFPITPPRQSPNPTRKRVAFNRHLAEEYPINILIAEDNSINREVAMGSLNKLGYTKAHITVAFDGLEAVQHYAASLTKPPEQRFDAILMDIWMPNMDGFEATSRILDLGKEERVVPKIIAVTADITGGCVDRAKASGMQGFLAKPYKVLDIEHLILQHFGKT